MIFAHEGDLVTCENGHPICTIAQDLETTQTVTAKIFKDWQIEIDTSPGAPIKGCPQCGRPFIMHPIDPEKNASRFPVGAKLFINGKWRP